MKPFIYQNETKIYFGPDQLENLGTELLKYGKKVLLCYGGGSIKKSGLYDEVIKQIKDYNLELYELSGIEPNPRITSVNNGKEICRNKKIDVLLAVGGGSVIDCTKVIGAASFYEGDAWDIVTGKVEIEKCLPIITILTLAATGSEMNTGAVISNIDTNDKLSVLSDFMLPKVSFLDPTLTYTVNQFQTATGAVDILSHIMEVYFNLEKDLFMLDKVMEGLMTTVIKYAPIALKEPNNYEARANIMWSSTWAINSFIEASKENDWIVHAIEHELSAFYDITHGLGLAIITPRWMKYCLNEMTVNKFYQFGVNVFGIDKNLEMMEVAKKAIEMLSDFFFNTLNLDDTLTKLNITDEHFDIMANKVASDWPSGFVKLSKDDIKKILNMCL